MTIKPAGSKLNRHAPYILGLVEANKDITLHEIADKLLSERGERTCPSTVWNFLSKHWLTHKKKTAHASEQERPDVLARRSAWPKKLSGLDPERLIFIDETGTNTRMARLRGWAAWPRRCCSTDR